MNVNIPEEPDDESIKLVLDCMEHCVRQQMRLKNFEQIKQLKGTAGEPIPEFDVDFYLAVRFKDDTTASFPVINERYAAKVYAGETLTLKVIENHMTPDVPAGYYMDCETDFRPPAPVGRRLF